MFSAREGRTPHQERIETMTRQFETVHVTAGRSSVLHGRYEFHVTAEVGDDEWVALAKGDFFRSKAAALNAARKAAEPFLAPSLF